ncbi:Uncharacterised protein [Bordetella pertussis]|nr:Uncharacterised protein [Bordetella pertussis]
MVADALERAGDEDHVDGARNGARVFHHVGDQVAQRRLPFLVDFLVAAHDLRGQDRIQAREGVQRLAQHIAHVHGHVAQFDQGNVTLVVLVHAAHGGGDLLGLVARALHVGQHLGDGQQGAQVDRGGLVARQDQADALVDLDFVPVDLFLALAHLLDHAHVAGRNGFDRFVDHGLDDSAHLEELRPHVLQVCVELFVGVLRHPDSLRGWSHL